MYAQWSLNMYFSVLHVLHRDALMSHTHQYCLDNTEQHYTGSLLSSHLCKGHTPNVYIQLYIGAQFYSPVTKMHKSTYNLYLEKRYYIEKKYMKIKIEMTFL